MRRCVTFAIMILTAPAAPALTLEELETARQQAAERAAEAAAIDLTGGPDGGRPVPGEMGGCIGSAPGGRISLLGVESDMGPSTQGVSPAAKLGPDHPAKRALAKVGAEMGLYNDREGASAEEKARNEAARVRKEGQHDYYAEVLALANMGRGSAERITELSDLAAGGSVERAAQAYKEYEVLARQYVSLYQAAEAAGRACP